MGAGDGVGIGSGIGGMGAGSGIGTVLVMVAMGAHYPTAEPPTSSLRAPDPVELRRWADACDPVTYEVEIGLPNFVGGRMSATRSPTKFELLGGFELVGGVVGGGGGPGFFGGL